MSVSTSTRKVDITPDKSLLEKLGKVGFSPEEAIAEFVDNSLDAKYDEATGTEVVPDAIEVKITLGRDQIVVTDNSAGIRDFDKCLKVAWSEKSFDSALGFYGLGLKTATMSLGRKAIIESKRVGESVAHSTELDAGIWMASPDWMLEISDIPASREEHFTRITMRDLNVDPTTYSEELREGLSERFGPFIQEGGLKLYVGGKAVEAPEVDYLSAGNPQLVKVVRELGLKLFRKRQDFEFHIEGMIVTGWVDLLEKRSLGGKFGFHLYRGKRLIQPYVKVGIQNHPGHANIFGHVFLPKEFPVSFTKNKVEIQRSAYIDLRKKLESACADHRRVAMKMAHEKAPVISKKMVTDVEKSIDALAESLKGSRLLKDLFPSDTKRSTEKGSTGFGDVDSEVRAPKLKKTATRPIAKNQKARNPIPGKPTQKKKHWLIEIGGFRIKLIHDWTESEEPKMWYSSLEEDRRPPELTVQTNVGFDAFTMTSDKVFYATGNVIMALARVILSMVPLERLGGRDFVEIQEDLYRSWARKIRSRISEAT